MTFQFYKSKTNDFTPYTINLLFNKMFKKSGIFLPNLQENGFLRIFAQNNTIIMKKLILRSILFLGIAVFLNSCCPSLPLYDKASKSFSQGAAITMKKRLESKQDSEPEKSVPAVFNLYPGSAAAQGGAAALYYDRAYAEIKTALSKDACLKKENVYGNALTIKALTEWQLATSDPAKYREAEQTAIQAREVLEKSAQRKYKDDRDLALMTALHGLISIDTVYQANQQLIKKMDLLRPDAANMTEQEAMDLWKELQQHYQQYITGEIESAYSIQFGLDQINAALPVAKNHKDVEQYLILSKLSGLRTWAGELEIINIITALAQINKTGTPVNDWIKAEEQKFNTQKEAALKSLEVNTTLGKDDPVYQFFINIM